MPKQQRVPSYRLHKARNCAVVTIDGQNVYLGPFGSAESHRRYAEEIAAWERNRGTASTDRLPGGYSCGRLSLDYLRFAQAYYVKNGRPTKQVHLVKQSLRTLCSLYEELPAADFGPIKLKNLQQHLIGQGQARTHINKQVACLKLAFKWASSEERIPAAVFHSLQTVCGLKQGRSTARETKPVLPVDEGTVNETVKFLSPVVVAMVQLQRLTGMRPGEVCQLRPMDLTFQLDGVACYRPESHKTEHLGRERRVYLGPQALAVMKPFLERDPESYCFSPRESAEWHLSNRRASRKTPMYPSHARVNAAKRKPHPRFAPTAVFSSNSYRQAVEKACQRAFRMPKDLSPDKAREWREKNVWTPNQLRHLRATEIRREFGIEAASVTLGHSNLSVTQTYAERDFARAAEIAKKIG